MAGAEARMSGAGLQQQPQPPAVGTAAAGDESSDSEGEHEGPQKLIRKVSTSGQIRSKEALKTLYNYALIVQLDLHRETACLPVQRPVEVNVSMDVVKSVKTLYY